MIIYKGTGDTLFFTESYTVFGTLLSTSDTLEFTDNYTSNYKPHTFSDKLYFNSTIVNKPNRYILSDHLVFQQNFKKVTHLAFTDVLIFEAQYNLLIISDTINFIQTYTGIKSMNMFDKLRFIDSFELSYDLGEIIEDNIVFKSYITYFKIKK